jgi:CubicO group peptidase (beta-lactamase class C family)
MVLVFEKYAGRHGPLRLSMLAAVVLVAVLTLGSRATAQVPQQEPSGPAPDGSGGAATAEGPAGRGPTDAREVEAFMDGFFAQQLEGYDIPGATVSVVSDGKVLFAKGYGEADVEANEPVVADETLFRIASTSKLFTSTAVMQLVEEGRLDLNEDVNAYLDDVEIPDTYPGEPVTLRHLLTHTAGFEESFTGTGARGAADVEPLGEYLSGKTPERVRPPGEAIAYSNFGMPWPATSWKRSRARPSTATSKRTLRDPSAWTARPSTSRPRASWGRGWPRATSVPRGPIPSRDPSST